MACYYLVISSTHLSNGHFRNIKGVFRGPLCKTAGNESPDYAEKEKAIARALEDLKANFYCELCDKQYHKHQEFDNHINSYDHAHKQRLKELKQREFARNVASKSWKDERKQERALRRLHQLAEQRQLSDCGPGSGPKFRTTATSPKAQNELQPEKDHGGENQPSPIVPGAISKDTVSSCPLEQPTHREPFQSRKRPSQSTCAYSHRRVGVSFCFSRKAQLKLESSASVFSDGLEEANDREELHRLRARQTLEALWSRSPSRGELAADNAEEEDQKRTKTEKFQLSDDIESSQNNGNTSHRAADEPESPQSASPCSVEDSCLGDALRETNYRPEPAGEFDEPEINGSFSPTAGISTPGHSAGADPSQVQTQGLTDESSWIYRDTETMNKLDNIRTEESWLPMAATKQITNNFSFLNVLSKDGETTLKWPTELLLYTKSKPYVSYSCNPLYFKFKHSRNKRKSKKSRKAMGADHSTVDNNVKDGDGRWSSHVQSQVQHKLSVQRPKRIRHHKTKKTRTLKSKPNDLDPNWMYTAGSFMESIEAFECASPNALQNNKHSGVKKCRLSKRKRSLKYISNGSDGTEHSLKSVISPRCTMLSKKKRRHSLVLVTSNLEKEFSPYFTPLSVKEENFAYHRAAKDPARGHRAASVSEKSGSCSSFSDLNSDSEGASYRSGRHPPSSGANYRPPPRRESSCSQTLGHKPSLGLGGQRSSWSPTEERPGSKRKDASADRIENPSRTSEWSSNLDKWSWDWKHRRRHDVSGQHSTDSCSSSSCCSTFHMTRKGTSGSPPAHRSTASRTHSVSRSRSRSPSRLHKSGSVTSDPDSGLNEVEVSRDNLYVLRPPSITVKRTEKGIRDQAGLQSIGKKTTGTAPNVNATHRSDELFPGDKSFARRKINSNLSLPLIGKFPAVRKSAKKGVSSKIQSNFCKGQRGIAGSTNGLEDTFCPGLHLQASTDSGLFPLSSQRPIPSPERQSPRPNGGGELGQSPKVVSTELNVFSSYSAEREKVGQVPRRQEPESGKSTVATSVVSEEPESMPERAHKCISPSLTEQPITFTPEEIDKYRHLQLQAQQHMQQQQLLVMQEKGIPEWPIEESSLSPASHPSPSLMPRFQPVPLLQPGPSLQHALLHHRAFTSSLQPHAANQHLAHHHLQPLGQPHFTPISISHMAPTAVLPAHPHALLAGHPLHFIPTSAFHPAHLALHPLPPGSLLPTLLAPSTAAASTLHLRPLLHPFFPRQNLQPHCGPNS